MQYPHDIELTWADGKQRVFFRGRSLDGHVVKVPEGYKGTATISQLVTLLDAFRLGPQNNRQRDPSKRTNCNSR
jgi:hypothetical protein